MRQNREVKAAESCPKPPQLPLSLLHRPHGTVVRSFQADTEQVTQAVFPTLGSKPGTTQPDSPTTGSDTPTKDNRNSFEWAPYNIVFWRIWDCKLTSQNWWILLFFFLHQFSIRMWLMPCFTLPSWCKCSGITAASDREKLIRKLLILSSVENYNICSSPHLSSCSSWMSSDPGFPPDRFPVTVTQPPHVALWWHQTGPCAPMGESCQAPWTSVCPA